LSAALRFGQVHPSALLTVAGTGSEFARQLAWRDFYADMLAFDPLLAWENADRRFDRLVVDTDTAARRRFAAFASARTGFPLVDAGVRELLSTGFVHNRVRMVMASFLVKDLHLPWQRGARFFLRHLVDGDLASNNLSWQWVAGSGFDAAPYHRVFNPTAQGERFDADGVYVRRHLPELAGVPDRFVHRPWAAPSGCPVGYPPPMVDHQVERAEALARFRALRS
jgi:deoxyribodipyrimidine photo-lyase